MMATGSAHTDVDGAARGLQFKHTSTLTVVNVSLLKSTALARDHQTLKMIRCLAIKMAVLCSRGVLCSPNVGCIGVREA